MKHAAAPATIPGDAILRADWPAPLGVVAFTTLRHGAGASTPPFDSFNLGVRCGDDPGAVARNRAELVERFGLPSAPHWLRQVHGTRAVRLDAAAANPAGARHARDTVPAGDAPHVESSLLDSDSRSTNGSRASSTLPKHRAHAALLRSHTPSQALFDEEEPEADAAVTSTPGVVLAILTADCLPVVLAVDDGSEIAAAHAGWRGLAAGVLENTLAAMVAPAGRIVAWLGPAAGPQAYEVGEEVLDAFVARDPRAAEAFAATRPGHWRVDLYALARRRLAAAGVDRVYGGGRCTISEPEQFFSHRRDRQTGRMATLVWREAHCAPL